MKKGFLIVSFALLSFLTIAQDDAKVKFGIYFGPSFSTSRVKSDEVKEANLDNNGTKIKFTGGISIERMFQSNISLFSGLAFKTKFASIKYIKDNQLYSPEAKMQYISLPVGLRFYTNEFADAFKIYFMAGANFDVKIDEAYSSNSHFTNADIEQANRVLTTWCDAGLIFSLGAEYNIPNTTNAVTFGFNYNRGLLNVMKNNFSDQVNGKKVSLRNDLYEIMLGFKF